MQSPPPEEFSDATSSDEELWVAKDTIDSSDKRPTPIEQVITARNLERFQDAKLKLKDEGRVKIDLVGRMARDIVSAPKLRNVEVYLRDGVCSIINRDDPNAARLKYNISQRRETREAVFAAMNVLVSRLPCEPNELSRDDIYWLLNIARKVANLHDPTIRAEMEEPILKGHKGRWSGSTSVPLGQRFSYVGKIRGLKPGTGDKPAAETWEMTIQVPVGNVAQGRDFVIPEGYTWNPAKAQNTSKDALEMLDTEASKRAKQLAMFLMVQFDGYIGKISGCKHYVEDLLKQYRLDPNDTTTKPKAKHPRRLIRNTTFGPHYGYPLWYGPHHNESTHINSYLEPGQAIRLALTSRPPPIILPTMSRKAWHPVLDSMLQQVAIERDSFEIWRTGCVVADWVAGEIETDNHDFEVVKCTRNDPTRHWHDCGLCAKAHLCKDVTYNNDERIHLCSECASLKESGVPLDLQIPYKDGESSLVRQLIPLLKEEHALRKSGIKLDSKTLRPLAEELVASDLDKYRITEGLGEGEEKFHDAYVDQELSTRAALYKDWRGKFVKPKGPTVDAIDPIHAVEVDGERKLGYHAPANLVVTSYSMNTLVRHHPKINYLALSQLRSAENREQYESAIAILRNCHVNMFQSGMRSSHQVDRIGHPLPDNYDELKATFRSGERLQNIDVHPAKLWRTSLAPRPANATTDWTYANWAYVWNGVQQIAERHGLADKPQHWSRRDEFSGQDIPFFFNEYSVVVLWDQYALMNMISERLIRLRTHCDRLYAAMYAEVPEMRPSFEPEVLVFEQAQLWMSLINENITKFSQGSWAEKPPTCDSWQLPIFPTVGMINCISFGKTTGGGTEMRTGYVDRFPQQHDESSWSSDRSGIDVETYGKNWARWTLDPAYMVQVEEQLDKIRGLLGTQKEPLIFPHLGGPIILRDPVLRKEVDFDNFRSSMSEYFRTGGATQAEIMETTSFFDNPPTDQPSAESVADEQAINEILSLPAILSSSKTRRNLERLGNSCWWSSAFQVIHKIPVLRKIFKGDLNVRPITGRLGRTPGTLVDDTTGQKHQKLINATSTLLNGLDQPGKGKIGLDLVRQHYDAYNEILEKPVDGFWDASEFFLHFLTTAIIALDRSTVQTTETGQERILIDGIMQKERQMGFPNPIKEDSKKFWNAHHADGNKSALANLLLLQVVKEQTCSNKACETIRRQFDSVPSLELILRNTGSADPVSLGELRQRFLCEENVGLKCRACTADLQDHVHQRIVRSSEILIINIRRAPLDPLTPSASGICRNQIQDFDTIDITDWSTYDDLPSAEYNEESFHVLQDGKYQAVALILFIPDEVHYVAVVRERTKWWLYNDLKLAPHRVNLDLLLSDPKHCICDIVYQRHRTPAQLSQQASTEEIVSILQDTVQETSEDAVAASEVVEDDSEVLEYEAELHPTVFLDEEDLFGDDQMSDVQDFSSTQGQTGSTKSTISTIRPFDMVKPKDTEILTSNTSRAGLVSRCAEGATTTSTPSATGDIAADCRDMFETILKSLQQAETAGGLVSARTDTRSSELDNRELRLKVAEERLAREQEKLAKDQEDLAKEREKIAIERRQLQASWDEFSMKDKAHAADVHKHEAEQRISLPFEVIKKRAMAPFKRTKDTQAFLDWWHQNIAVSYRETILKEVLREIFQRDDIGDFGTRLAFAGYLFSNIPVRTYLKYVINNWGIKHVLQELLTTTSLTTLMSELSSLAGIEEVLSKAFHAVAGDEAVDVTNVIARDFMTRLFNLFLHNIRRSDDGQDDDVQFVSQHPTSLPIPARTHIPPPDLAHTGSSTFPSHQPTVTEQQASSSTTNYPRQNLGVGSIHRPQTSSSIPTRLGSAFRTPIQASAQPAQAPGTSSTVGEPNEYGKRGVKAAAPGTPSGAEARLHKRPLTAVPERNEPIVSTASNAPAISTESATPAIPVTPTTPSDPSMRRYAQDTAASSLRRAGSVASIRTVQSIHTSQTSESRDDESESPKKSKSRPDFRKQWKETFNRRL